MQEPAGLSRLPKGSLVMPLSDRQWLETVFKTSMVRTTAIPEEHLVLFALKVLDHTGHRSTLC